MLPRSARGGCAPSPKKLSPAYKGYLVNCLRKAFGLEGAPVVLQFRSRERKKG